MEPLKLGRFCRSVVSMPVLDGVIRIEVEVAFISPAAAAARGRARRFVQHIERMLEGGGYRYTSEVPLCDDSDVVCLRR